MAHERFEKVTIERGFEALQRKLKNAHKARPYTPHVVHEKTTESVHKAMDVPTISLVDDTANLDQDWALHMQEVIPNTWVERYHARTTTESIKHGMENPFDYETFHCQERVYSGAKKYGFLFLVYKMAILVLKKI